MDQRQITIVIHWSYLAESSFKRVAFALQNQHASLLAAD
jgi:hypothetical protein